MLIEREFSEPDDLEQALDLVRQSQGIQRARTLAESMARESTTNLKFLPASASRDALDGSARFCVEPAVLGRFIAGDSEAVHRQW